MVNLTAPELEDIIEVRDAVLALTPNVAFPKSIYFDIDGTDDAVYLNLNDDAGYNLVVEG